MPKFQISDVVTAFNEITIGTKVRCGKVEFMRVVMEAMAKHDTSTDREPGQSFVMLPESACSLVSCGVGRHTGYHRDYHVRFHRGEPQVFLHRGFADETTKVAVVVYTRKAYLADPQVTDERRVALDEDTEYVLVAVLGFADSPKPEVSSHRFVRNLAGGNNEYDMVGRVNRAVEEHPHLTPGSDPEFELRTLKAEVQDMTRRAQATVEYELSWCTVADAN